jgi:hypothetical protein
VEPRFAVCAECGNRFDASLGGFCPRCGAIAPPPGAPGAPAAAGTAGAPGAPQPGPARRHPLRRRVQVGGILLSTWGLLLTVSCLVFLALPTSVLQGQLDTLLDEVRDAPLSGGQLHLQVLANGTPTQALVEVHLPGGRLLWANQTVGGWANVTLGNQGSVNVTVRAGGHVLQRRAVALANDTLEARVDVARDPATAPRLGTERLVLFVRLAGAVVGVGALLLLGGGIAALAVRWPILAIAGPVPVLAITVLLAVATPYAGILVILALQAVGLALVVSGRPAFRRR